MVTLEFHSTEKSQADSKMRVYCNNANELYINIVYNDDEQMFGHICLDKETAIKFAKEVKKQISFLED